MSDQQAHAMSHPKAQCTECSRLSAEIAYRTQLAESIEWELRGKLADRDAEIERLRSMLPRIATALPHADHRLGIPQPDGEPVAPMSARKAYRWGMI